MEKRRSNMRASELHEGQDVQWWHGPRGGPGSWVHGRVIRLTRMGLVTIEIDGEPRAFVRRTVRLENLRLPES